MDMTPGDAPPAGGWTIDDLDALPEDGRRRELLDGALHVPPTPSAAHQAMTARLMVALEASCPATLDVTQRMQIRISRTRAFVPDGIVTRFGAAADNPTWYSPEDVLLAVEIVADGSKAMDRWLKPGAYAAAGIPFFWRVEIDGGIAVHAHKLNPASVAYEEVGVFTTDLVVTEPWPITLSLTKLLPRQP